MTLSIVIAWAMLAAANAASSNVPVWIALIGMAGTAVIGPFVQWLLGQFKSQPETDNFVVVGAEKAVNTLAVSLAAETARADRAEAAVRERDEKIKALEEKLDVLQSALDELRAEIRQYADHPEGYTVPSD